MGEDHPRKEKRREQTTYHYATHPCPCLHPRPTSDGICPSLHMLMHHPPTQPHTLPLSSLHVWEHCTRP
eukprot:4433089-Prorocentrum_lima.AAC.1